jgi:hypothetical protein
MAILALLTLGPCVRADTFVVTSGYFQPIGAPGDNLFLAGDGFTAIGFIQLAPIGCHGEFLPGQPITGCVNDWITGVVNVTTSAGVVEQVEYGYDFLLDFSQADITLSGPTSATLVETASMSNINGCINVAFAPNCTPVDLIMPENMLLTINLVQIQDDQSPFAGGYEVTSEKYTISTPEPGMIVLVGIGLAGLALRRRFA